MTKQMSATEQKKKAKAKKTYEELAEEIRSNIRKTAVVYVPELAYALIGQGLSNTEAKHKILEDFGNGRPWDDSSIYKAFPIELRDPKETRGRDTTFGISPKKREEVTEQIAETLKPIPNIPESGEDEDRDKETISTISMDEYEETHPSVAETPFEKIGKINRAIASLWTGLTGDTAQPNDDDLDKLIKTSRPDFLELMNQTGKEERAMLFNWLVWLTKVAKDRLQVIEAADKTAYDTRE